MSALREPVPFEVYEAGVYLHGTKADLAVGDLLISGRESNFEAGRVMNYVYFSATLDAAVWGAELASGEGRGRIYVVEPTGEFEDDPNLTDKKFPGNPTQSFRSREPLRVVRELVDWSAIRPRSSRPCEPHSMNCSGTKRRRSRTKSPRGRQGLG
jgi:rifampin ADP-ribosylating transferase